MRGIVAIASVVVLLSAVGGAAHAVEPYILNLSGNNFSTNEAAQLGQQLRVVAMLSQVQDTPPFALPGITGWTTEYTINVAGLALASVQGGVKTYTGGTIELWSEAPPDAPWTPTTPVSTIPAFNGVTVPATFTDGTLLLSGAFTQFATLFFGGQTGTVTSTINWTGGSKLSDLQALGIASGWHWNGFFNVNAPVPPGYFLLYGGKLEHEVPVAVEAATWGSIKNLMRAE